MTASDAKKSKRKSKNRPNTVHHTNVHHLSRPTRENAYTHTGSASLSSHINSSLTAYKCCIRLILTGLAVCRANWLRIRLLLKGTFIVCEDWPSHAIFHIFTLARNYWSRNRVHRSPCVSTSINNSSYLWVCERSDVNYANYTLPGSISVRLWAVFWLVWAAVCRPVFLLCVFSHSSAYCTSQQRREKRTQHAFFCVY